VLEAGDPSTPSKTCNENCREIIPDRVETRRDPTAKEAGMRTAVRVRLGALVAGAALGGLALAAQASAAPSYGPVYSPTPVTVNVPGFISISGLGGPLGFGSVTPGSPLAESGPLVQVITTNNPFGYNFTADWTGFTGPTPAAVPPVLQFRVNSGPADADYTGPPPSNYFPLGTYAPVPVGSSQIAQVHRQTPTAGDVFLDQSALDVGPGVTAGDYSGTLTFTAVSLP
jgi:hypothetical protein